MGYKQDWVIRQIDNMVRLVSKLIFNKDLIQYEIRNYNNLSETDKIYQEIQKLLKDEKICEAEDLLFENIDKNNEDCLKLSIDFYYNLNELEDEKLEKCNFSRKEIEEGLNEILEIYKIPKIGL